MRTLSAFALVFTLVGYMPNVVNPTIAEAPPVNEIQEIKKPLDPADKDGIKSFIAEEANKHGVRPEFSLCIARIESINFREDVIRGLKDGDTDLLDIDGDPHRSCGLWQINQKAHGLCDTIAKNIESSTEWAMPRLKRTPWIWTGSYAQCKHLE